MASISFFLSAATIASDSSKYRMVTPPFLRSAKPLYVGFLVSSADSRSVYESRTYGPEPVSLPSLRSWSAGYSAGSTRDIAGVARTIGKVASDLLSRKTTVRSPTVSILSSEPSMPFGPPLKLIVRMRSIEYCTALASSLCPLENVRPSRSLHSKTRLEVSENLQSAASESGVVLPVGKLTRVWKTFRKSSHELSQAAAGSSVVGELVVPTTIL